VNEAFIADASVGGAWAVKAQSSPATDHLLERITTGSKLLVPALWFFEVANALIVLMRRKRITPAYCALARRALSRLTPLVDDEGSRLAFGQITELAEEHALSVYDATYLELSARRGLPLASRDAALVKAAVKCAITTLF